MQELWQDMRYAVRTFFKTPGLTLVALLSMAFAIAASASVFTLVNAALFKTMPVGNPDRLVVLYTTNPNESYPSGFSYPEYIDYRDNTRVFSDLFVHSTVPISLKLRDGLAEMAAGELVTGNFFAGLRLDAAIGRLLTPDDDRKSGSPVVVLGYGFWQRRFGGDPNVVGQVVKLNGHDFTIVGVARKGFSGTRQLGWIPDVYLTLMTFTQAIPGTSEQLLNNRSARWLDVNGRLADGVTIEQARSALTVFSRQLARDYPKTNENVAVGVLPGGTKTEPMIALMGYAPIASGLLMGLVGLVLLVACANVANLLLARAMARRGEIAVRLALGASRQRLVRQLLTESLMLSVLGGAIGLLLAIWFNQSFQLAAPPLDFASVDFDYELSLDYRILGFTMLVSILTGIMFGLAPTLQASKLDLVPALRRESRNTVPGLRRLSTRNLLVVSQVALSLMLLVSAGLLVKSMRNVQTMNPGFRMDRVLMASVNLELHNYDEAKGRRFYKELSERLNRMPGVERASFAGPLPLDQYGYGTEVAVADRVPTTKNERLSVTYSIVDHDYFATMETPIVRGRGFTDRDNQEGPRVVVVNETMANRYWPGQEPIGKRIRIGNEKRPWLEVIGIARDGKYHTLGEPPTDYVFLPFWQNYDGRMTLLLHTTGAPEGLIENVRLAVKELDEELPVYGVRNAPQYFDRLASGPKSIAALVSLFGLLALALAAVGLYGVMSYTVAQRTREIGIRVALGARPRDAMKLILRQGIQLSFVGTAAGLVGAFALTRLLSSLLYGVSSTDPLIFVVTSAILAVVAVGATLVPARRATNADPLMALRCD